tara:strand:+ start:14970 stop:15929 length:960 start_codon:yes stop_codon:yes gene_type:complete
MKNYTKIFFIFLILLPLTVSSQNKKKLKGDIAFYKDSIIHLKDSIYYIKKKLNLKDLDISKLESKIQNLEKQNAKLQNTLDKSQNTLDKYQKELTNLETKNSNLNLKYDDIKQKEIKLNDSIDFLNKKLTYQISQVDSLKDIEFQNIILLTDIIEDSEFDCRDVYGSWDLKTMFLSQKSEFINFESVYSYDRHNDQKFKADKSVLEKIVLMDPNIAVVELKDGHKISCLFEITIGAESGLRKNLVIKFVDTDREEFKFVISEYEGAYIFKYDYSSLVSFFDRNEYNEGYTENFRIRGVTYEDEWDVLNDYDINIVGIIK